jgi:hypothetical protein
MQMTEYERLMFCILIVKFKYVCHLPAPQSILARLPLDVKLHNFNLAREHTNHEARMTMLRSQRSPALPDETFLCPPMPQIIPSSSIEPTYLVDTSSAMKFRYRSCPEELILRDGNCCTQITGWQFSVLPLMCS